MQQDTGRHLFELIGVTKRYGETEVIKPVNLGFPRGETTALIGTSGSGKSTLMRMLIGLVRPDSGRVLFDASPVTPDNVLEIRHQIGYVVQEGGLFPHMTAGENVSLMARQLGRSRDRILERTRQLGNLTHMPADLMSRYPGELSGGQRRRVSLMRAMMLEPDALLLDEPLGALDPMVRFELQGDLKEIFLALGKTVVLVTHDLAEAFYFAHRLVLVSGGEVVQQGTAEEFLHRPANDFVKRFMRAQRPPVGLFDAGAS